jgi:transposase
LELETSRAISAAELERMMKMQDVILKAMAKKITWLEAAEIIGLTERTMRRWRERWEEHGYSGLADQRKGKVSFRRVPLKTCEEVLRLYREKYFDCSMLHFHEKLREVHGIKLSYTWVQQALQGAGMVKRRMRSRRRDRDPPSAGIKATSLKAAIRKAYAHGGTCEPFGETWRSWRSWRVSLVALDHKRKLCGDV